VKKTNMTSLQRVLTALGHEEPDRVPLFLLLTMHGAKELGQGIKEYFSKAEHVAEGQLRLREKYKNDCLYSFFYAPVEIEAWGGEVIFSDNGPPNSGHPFIRDNNMIRTLAVPDIENTPCLAKVLSATKIMKDNIGDEAPIVGVVMSPFSLPVMQMGFEAYLDLIYRQPDLFEMLMEVNTAFCANWANAQLNAGATAICYFDPVSSPTIVPRELYLRTGYLIAKKVIGMIKGPTATHMASGRALPIINDITQTGTAVVGVSSEEDLSILKEACSNKITVLGNLNGLAMINWSRDDAFAAVRKAIAEAAAGGGFILSDNHGEIPFQVSDETLLAVSEAVQKYGFYSINDAENDIV